MNRSATVHGQMVIRIPKLLDLILIVMAVLLMRGSTNPIEVYSKWALSFLWILGAYISNPALFNKILSLKYVICLVLYIGLKTLINVMSADSVTTALGGSISMIPFYIGILAVPYYAGNKKRLSIVIPVLIVTYCFICIEASKFYIENPEAARAFGSYRDAVAIGSGYGIGFAAAVLSVYCVGILRTQYKSDLLWNKRYVLIAVMIISIITCLLVKSTITILAMVIGILFNLFYSSTTRGIKSNKKIVSFSLATLFIVSLFIFKDDIAKLLIRTQEVNRTAVTDRLAVIGKYILFQEDSIAISGRVHTYMQSIKHFFENPFLGGSFKLNYEQLYTIGDHSSILDEFGRYGFFTGVLHLCIYTGYHKRLRYARATTSYGAAITLFLIAIFDPITQPSASVVIFMLVGFIDEYMCLL